jgi:hypothetical protein
MTENNQLAHVPVGDKGVQFADMDGMIRFAGAVCRAGLAPRGLEKPEQVFIALQMGMEVGLSPMQSLQNIAVINGKPSIYGDGALALVYATGLVTDFEEKIEHEGDDRVAYCSVERAGVKTACVRSFSVADAKDAGLWGKTGPWKQYSERMLQMRARGFALRDSFPDALHGLITAEEAQDYPEQKARQVAAEPVTTEARVVEVEEPVEEEPKPKAKRKAKAKKAEPEAEKADDAEAIAWAKAEVSKPDAEPILTYSEEEDGPLGDLFED